MRINNLYNVFAKKSPLQMFYRVLNTILWEIGLLNKLAENTIIWSAILGFCLRLCELCLYFYFKDSCIACQSFKVENDTTLTATFL